RACHRRTARTWAIGFSRAGGGCMNEDTLTGQWNQLKGKAREKWGELTDDDLDVIQGQSEQLVGRIQERYGLARDEAERQVQDWLEDTEDIEDAEERTPIQ